MLYNGMDAPSLRVLLVAGPQLEPLLLSQDVIPSRVSAWVRARTDAGTPMPARRSGAGCGSPYWTRKGMTPAQVLPATSSAGSVGQAPEIFSDQSWIGMASTMVAASSRRRVARISARRHFIAAGHLASHLARAARTYAGRRRALIAGLRSMGLRITGVDAGLHLVADLPPGADEAEVQRRLAEAGLAVDVLGQFSTAPLHRRALVCGYALLPETQAAAAAAAIAESLAAIL